LIQNRSLMLSANLGGKPEEIPMGTILRLVMDKGHLVTKEPLYPKLLLA
jgi:hypothetical protein